MNLRYDGSFHGFLSAVFYAYAEKLGEVRIRREEDQTLDIFEDIIRITTKEDHTKRVWEAVKKKAGTAGSNRFYKAFLNDRDQVEDILYNYCRYLFESKGPVGSNYANNFVLKVQQLAKSVHREKHRMEAFVRFRLTKDGLYFASVEPDFNVLPLIKNHFEDRYADQKWMIYDLRRKYGLYYDLEKTMEVQMTFEQDPQKTTLEIFTEEEIQFQALWKGYFDSVNIKERANRKLHLQHVPKRYWKHLSEKKFAR